MVFLCQRLGISFVVTYIPKRKLRISDHRSTNFDTIQIFKQVHFWFMLLSISQPCLLVTVQSSYKINNVLYNNKILQFYTREKKCLRITNKRRHLIKSAPILLQKNAANKFKTRDSQDWVHLRLYHCCFQSSFPFFFKSEKNIHNDSFGKK